MQGEEAYLAWVQAEEKAAEERVASAPSEVYRREEGSERGLGG